MAQDYSIRFTGDSSQLQKSLNDTKEKFKQITESSASLARKIGMIKKEMERMATTGLDTTDEGKEMWRELALAAQQYDEMLKRIQADTRSVGSESQSVGAQGGISQNLTSNIDFKSIGTDLLNKSGLGGVSSALSSIAGAVNPVTIGLTAVGGTMIAAGKAASDFEKHLDSLQGLTGLTDDEMKAVSDGAVDMSRNFNASAGDIVDSMKLIGSQAPQLLKDKDALMKVTEAANVLAEAAEIEVVDAAKAITGTMNQMGVSASEATNIINTFAAASQQGSANVAYLNKAFEKSGTAASDAGMSYVELSAAIEAVAPKFSSADVAGGQLANTLLKLSMSGKSDFTPSVVGMSKALENLANAEMNDVEMKNLVGESNITMLKTLIQSRNAFDDYSKSLAGTNTAYEQMEINGDNFEGCISRMKSAWEAFLIILGQSGIIKGIADNVMLVMSALGDVINVISDIIKSFDAFSDSGIDNINILKSQLDYLVGVIRGVGEAVQIVIRLIAKAFNWLVGEARSAANWIGTKWDELKKKLGDVAFARYVINAFNKVVDAAANMCATIRKYWNQLKKFLGMKVEADVDVKTSHTDANVESLKTTAQNGVTSADTGKEKKAKISRKTEKIDYLVSVDDNSLETAEKKLQAWTSKKKTLNIDEKEALEKCQNEIEKWQQEVIYRKLAIDADESVKATIEDIKVLEAQLSELRDKKVKVEVEKQTIDKNSVLNSETATKSSSSSSKFTEISTISSSKSASNAVENLENQGKSIVIDVEANLTAVKDVEKELNSIDNKTVNVDVKVDRNSDEIDEIDDEIERIQNEILLKNISIGITPEIEAGSKADLEAQIKKLDESKKILFRTNTDPSTVKQLEDELKALKAKLEAEDIRLGVKPELVPGSLNFIKEKIKKTEEELNLLLNTDVSSESIREVQNKLKQLHEDEKNKEIELNIRENTATISKKEETFKRGSVEDKRQSLSNAQSMVAEIQENYKLKIIGKDEVESQLNEINTKLQELGLKPITLTFNDDGTLTTATENLERYKQKMGDVSSIVGSVGNVFSSLGGSIEGTAGEVLNFAGASINAISQIIPQIVTMITAKQAEAMASGTASASAMPFPANIAAIASIIATIAGVFASLPKFESGGIVGGSSFRGDKLLARVNSGEMILNKKQQMNLYNSMNQAEIGVPMQNTLKGDVNFTISGSSLYGALKNYNSKMSKIK